MKLTNRTSYRTDQLKAILQRCAEMEVEAEDRKRLVVTVKYSRRPGRYSGHARLGGQHCTRGPLPVTLCLPKPGWTNGRKVAWLACHEFAHSRGTNHRNMAAFYRWPNFDHERYAWAFELPLEAAPVQAKPKPDRAAAQSKRLDHARAMLKKADTRLKRATTIHRKWKRAVARLTKALAVQEQLPMAAGGGNVEA